MLALAAMAALASSVAGSPGALAQASANCGEIQRLLLQRKTLTEGLQTGKGRKIDAKVACTKFGQLVTNGQAVVKWVDANKDWCQIPDAFAQGIKADHARAMTIRGQACGVAAKQAQMEKQAREGGGSSGLLGGGGLEGPTTLPKGAL